MPAYVAARGRIDRRRSRAAMQDTAGKAVSCMVRHVENSWNELILQLDAWRRFGEEERIGLLIGR